MRKISTTLGYILLLFLTLSSESAFAQNKPQAVTEATNAAFALKEGDRVVFLGNSLFENDLQYGYLELALTTRWPNRNVTYRNIGWTGDTVWGEARSYMTNPPTAYDLMIEQLTKAQPTFVFIAYGAIEALEGEAGLSCFNQGLNQLLDKIDQLGAKAILLSPIPVLSAAIPEDLAKRNAMLELYAAAIAKTASARGKRYISKLGESGKFRVSNARFVRRWETVPANKELSAKISNAGLGHIIKGNARIPFQPAYSTVSGDLPIEELPVIKVKTNQRYSFVRFGVEVLSQGKVNLAINSTAGITAWVGQKPLKLVDQGVVADLSQGVHQITLAIDREVRQKGGLSIQLQDAEHSPAQTRLIMGQ